MHSSNTMLKCVHGKGALDKSVRGVCMKNSDSGAALVDYLQL